MDWRTHFSGQSLLIKHGQQFMTNAPDVFIPSRDTALSEVYTRSPCSRNKVTNFSQYDADELESSHFTLTMDLERLLERIVVNLSIWYSRSSGRFRNRCCG